MTIKKQQAHDMSVVKMRMLRSVFGKFWTERNRNEYTLNGTSSTNWKYVEREQTKMVWYVQWRLVDEMVEKNVIGSP